MKISGVYLDQSVRLVWNADGFWQGHPEELVDDLNLDISPLVGSREFYLSEKHWARAIAIALGCEFDER